MGEVDKIPPAAPPVRQPSIHANEWRSGPKGQFPKKSADVGRGRGDFGRGGGVAVVPAQLAMAGLGQLGS